MDSEAMHRAGGVIGAGWGAAEVMGATWGMVDVDEAGNEEATKGRAVGLPAALGPVAVEARSDRSGWWLHCQPLSGAWSDRQHWGRMGTLGGSGHW
jgi:hypothetical protein